MSGALNPTQRYMGSNGSKRRPAGTRVAVIGAGFAGLSMAAALARLGCNVDVYEEHRTVGWPPHCTGIVSTRTTRLIDSLFGHGFASHVQLDVYEGAVICSLGACATFRVKEGVVRLDRVRLENNMLELLIRKGLIRFYEETRVSKVQTNGAIHSRDSIRRYDAIALAEGLSGRLREALRIGYRGPPSYGANIPTPDEWLCEDLIKPVPLDRRFVYTIFDARVSPGYVWVVPTRRGCVVGAASRSPEKLRRFILDIHKHKIKIEKPYGGRLLLAHKPPYRQRAGRVIAVGDAAGLAKPLSGGGLYPQSLVASRTAGLDCRRPIYSMLEAVVVNVISRLRSFSGLAWEALSNPRLAYCVLSSLGSDTITDAEYDDHLSTALRMARRMHYLKLTKCAGINTFRSLRVLWDLALSGVLRLYRLLAPPLP